MKGRDKLVLMGVIVFVVLGGVWMLVVSPERKQAGSLDEQVSTAKAALSSAEGELSKARVAKAQYGADYASIVSLGKAVPASDETPSLLYEIADASEGKDVHFESITSSGTPASAASAGFSALPLTFGFAGTFFNLEHLFRKLTDLATLTPSGKASVNGRLLSIQSVSLAAGGDSTSSKEGKPSNEVELSGSVTATAYVLPAGQSVAGGASPAAPAGAAVSTPTSTTTAAGSSSTAPATVMVNP